MTDVCTAALLPTKPSSDEDPRFRHGFRVKTSLQLAISHYTIRLCWIVVHQWNFHIHADAVRALSWIFLLYFLLSDGESPKLVTNMRDELVMKLRHSTLIGSTLVIQPFLTHCAHKSSNFSNLCWYALSKFSSKGAINSMTKTFFNLTDKMTISGY